VAIAGFAGAGITAAIQAAGFFGLFLHGFFTGCRLVMRAGRLRRRGNCRWRFCRMRAGQGHHAGDAGKRKKKKCRKSDCFFEPKHIYSIAQPMARLKGATIEMNRIDVNTMTMESHAHILAALAAYEAGQVGKPPPPTRFAVRNPWLVRAALLPGLLRGMLALSPAPVPGLQYKHIFGVLASLKPGDAPLRLASAADAIQIKKEDQTRIRAFYLPQEGRDGECLKLVSARHGIAARTRQELDLRRRLESLGTITLPKITAVAEDEDYIYIREEMVLGRRFDIRRDAALFLREGLPQLAATYRAMGLRQ